LAACFRTIYDVCFILAYCMYLPAILPRTARVVVGDHSDRQSMERRKKGSCTNPLF
jgi:hypothetical protein